MARRPSPETARTATGPAQSEVRRPVFVDRVSPRAWSPASPKMVAPVVGPAVVVPLPQLPVATTWGWKPKDVLKDAKVS